MTHLINVKFSFKMFTYFLLLYFSLQICKNYNKKINFSNKSKKKYLD